MLDLASGQRGAGCFKRRLVLLVLSSCLTISVPLLLHPKVHLSRHQITSSLKSILQRPKSDDDRKSLPNAEPVFNNRLLVDPDEGLLSILTPVFPDEKTLNLLRNQLRTFSHFFTPHGLVEWVFVSPAASLDNMTRYLDKELQLLDIPKTLIRIVADEQCAPELEQRAFKSIVHDRAPYITNWLKQQVLKLACADHMRSPFYLITDADTIYLRPLSAANLLDSQAPCTDQSCICDINMTRSYRVKTEMQWYRTADAAPEKNKWVVSSSKTLQMHTPHGTNRSIGVTPQTLATPIIKKLTDHLENLPISGLKSKTWRELLLTTLAEHRVPCLDHDPPWTEYDLYWVFAHNMGLWDFYHVHAQLQAVDANAWYFWQFRDWDPCSAEVTAAVDTSNPGYWATVQSDMKLDGNLIWDKLKHCLVLGN